jgi:hypothetical protein
LRENITLFSCLLFTPLSTQLLPITSENFYLFFIAFIVTFFLLGIIIGYVLNPRRKLRKKNEKPLIESSKVTMEEPKDLGQDRPLNGAGQPRGPGNRDPRNGNYNNYWGYYNNQTRR